MNRSYQQYCNWCQHSWSSSSRFSLCPVCSGDKYRDTTFVHKEGGFNTTTKVVPTTPFDPKVDALVRRDAAITQISKYRGNHPRSEKVTDCFYKDDWRTITHFDDNCSCIFYGTAVEHYDSRCTITPSVKDNKMYPGYYSEGENITDDLVRAMKKTAAAIPQKDKYIPVKPIAIDPDSRLDYNQLYWKYVHAPGDVEMDYLHKLLDKVTLDMTPGEGSWVKTEDPLAEKSVETKPAVTKPEYIGFWEAYKKMKVAPKAILNIFLLLGPAYFILYVLAIIGVIH